MPFKFSSEAIDREELVSVLSKLEVLGRVFQSIGFDIEAKSKVLRKVYKNMQDSEIRSELEATLGLLDGAINRIDEVMR